MADKRDTDTLTRIDPTPELPTQRQEAAADAETHRLDPRAIAPLRVCPQCSLAWEIAGDWCPSCGTAFEKDRREAQAPTRVMSQTRVARRHGGQPPLARSAKRRAAAQARAQTPPPPALPTAATDRRSGGSTRVVLTVLGLVAAIVVAFLVGQATRPSSAEVDSRAAEAAQTARESAAASYQRAFDKMQSQAAKAIADARNKALAEGEAKARSEIQRQADNSRSIFDSVTACVLRGDC